LKLLTYPNILKKFQKHVEQAKSVDLAIAWVTNSSALDLLRQQASQRSLKIRALVGIDTNFTHPVALQTLASFADVRVVKSTQGIFHPKMYLFHLQDDIVVWVGSANFSNSGLNSNEELVSECISSNEDAKKWFESRWQSISSAESGQLMVQYEKNWKPVHTENLLAPSKVKTSTSLTQSKVNLDCDWESYLEQLHRRDRYWMNRTQVLKHPFSVLGDSSSYLETIADGHSITLYASWNELSYREAAMLLGLCDEYGVHGLLGSMRGAGRVRQVFTKSNDKNLKIRQSILQAVQTTTHVTDPKKYLPLAEVALEKITQYDNFGMGVATRLLTLARPDMAISLNKASQSGLAKFSGMAPTTLHNIPKYLSLLQWMYEQDWYKAPSPTDPWEKSIWEKRAALLDAFVYDDRV
jgi:HKD family nuclease